MSVQISEDICNVPLPPAREPPSFFIIYRMLLPFGCVPSDGATHVGEPFDGSLRAARAIGRALKERARHYDTMLVFDRIVRRDKLVAEAERNCMRLRLPAP